MKRRPENTRLQNLERLINEAGSAVELARLVGTSSSYISQVRHQMPTQKGTPRTVGKDLAAKLERGMDKHEGWMDEQHKPMPTSPKSTNMQISQSLYPLISWVQAGEWMEISEGYTPQYAEELLPCPVKCSKDSYVLNVHGISMEPKFHDGDLIFVDPHVDPASGKYVVVMFEDAAEATLKQLIIEGDQQYLKALNPDWPNRIIELNSAATIGGVVVFKGEFV